jgi:general secretion pathway protein L
MLTLPFTRARQLEQTVPFELASQLPLELDTLVVDFHIVQQTPEGTTVLAVATPKITLTEHLATLSEAGFDPTRIGLAPLAPLAMLTAARAELSGATLLLHIEANRTDLVFLHNGMLSGLRTLSIGLNHASEFLTFLRNCADPTRFRKRRATAGPGLSWGRLSVPSSALNSTVLTVNSSCS